MGVKTAALDSLIHAPNRLQICALLMPLEEAEFQMLRETIGISDSVLSKHLAQLEAASYVSVRKGPVNGRQRTWASLTRRGRHAFEAHVAALQQITALAHSNPTSVYNASFARVSTISR